MSTSQYPRKITMENYDYDKVIKFSKIVNNDSEYEYILEDRDLYGFNIINEEVLNEEHHDTN